MIFGKFLSFTQSAKTYEFTARAVNELSIILEQIDPEDVDSQIVYEYLLGLKPIAFGNYLKRWIYRKSEMTEVFDTVPDSVFQEIIKQSFYERHTPFAQAGTVRKPSAVIKDWLSRSTIHRETMFLLGMGLGMSEREVSEFLTKVCREYDFDLASEKEVLYWHCLKAGKDYAQLQNLKQRVGQTGMGHRSRHFYKAVRCNPEQYLFQEEIVLDYASWLRANSPSMEVKKQRIFRGILKELSMELGMADRELTPAEMEKCFYMAIPRTEAGNLKKAVDSNLNLAFRGYRLTRQRLNQLLNGRLEIGRNDLITCLFFLYAVRSWEKGSRAEAWVRRCNQVLFLCDMHELYLTEPYEAFLAISIYVEEPLELYSEILELSYGITYSEIDEI